MRLILLGILAVANAPTNPAVLLAQKFDSTTSRAVAPGVIHRQIVINSGPWRINVLEVNLRQPGLRIVGVRASDRFTGRETVSSMVQRYKGPGKVTGAVNGDFFNIRGAGESENNVVIEGKLVKGVKVTDSPYDRFENPHSQFAVDSANRPLIERFVYSGNTVLANGWSIPLTAVNSLPAGNALVLYTRDFGDHSPADSVARHPLSLRLKQAGRRDNTPVFRIDGKPVNGGSIPLAGGAVIAAEGAARAELRQIAGSHAPIRIISRLVPHGKALRTVMGGWPRLVVHGASVADSVDRLEGTFPGFSAGRHPRTAVGFSRDSATLYLVTVDGRQESRAGMSLAELAKFMLDLGVYEGMNFDGGGSTTMVVDGKLVNSPSDKTGERAVGSGLLVVTRK